MTVTAANDKADLGDLTYNASLTHRLTIQLSGNAPGTGTNTPTGVDAGIAAVPMKKPGRRDLRLHPGHRRQGHRDGRLARDRRQRQLRGLPPQARRHPRR